MSSEKHGKKGVCPDCGEYPVNHVVEWNTALFESASEPLFMPLEGFAQKLQKVSLKLPLDRMALPFFKTLAFLRLGSIKTGPDARDSHRNSLVWEAAEKRGITMHQFRVLDHADGINFFVAQRGSQRRTFEGIPKPVRGPSASLVWMDNKGTLKKKFTAAGIPMAKGRAYRTYAEALKTMNEVGTPVITKPHIGSRARHSTVHINTPEELKKGFLSAKKLSPWVIVEQELQGYLFRITLVNKRPVAIVRREPPLVTGDGTHTVRELVEKENENPKRVGPTFHPIITNEIADRELARQNLNWESVPKKDVVVTLHSYISRFYGGATTDFTDRVHPDNVKLFERIGEVLDDSLVGVDFIIGDMERSWREQKLCGVIECNSLPNIDLHHDVLYGINRDIAGMLLDIAFPG
jgi:D-alanine-D-alanine ligase-like ATP-grasp enzyme